jgi:hypothetical protein
LRRLSGTGKRARRFFRGFVADVPACVLGLFIGLLLGEIGLQMSRKASHIAAMSGGAVHAPMPAATHPAAGPLGSSSARSANQASPI